MPDLLFELGCEELPASFVERASQDLRKEVSDRLLGAGMEFGKTEVYCTPRRLILSIEGLPEKQADQSVEQRGPSESAAYQNGVASKALEGFCRGQQVDVKDVELRDGYVWVTKHVAGLKTTELLQTVLPDSIRALTFDKTMRWGQSRMRFARPIRWILAVFGGELVPFSVEDVVSGTTSRGHRFMNPEPFEALNCASLLSELRTRMVEPDPSIREKVIREQAVAVASGQPDLPAGLVDENVFLTEWPMAHEGEFSAAFENLPESVLVTAMAKHERFFPVRNADGKLIPKFVSIRNNGEEDSVKAGNEWVLNARFNDAQFFFDEDKKKSLDEFYELTERMLFQDKLGTVKQRAGRLSLLANTLARETGGSDEDQKNASLAAHYAKADLASGLVGELSSLQGVIGGEYARREGMADAICDAIGCQYDHSKAKALQGSSKRTALTLILADHLDKLTGFLGMGIVPKGSSDPFGLRRSATVLIESAWMWDGLLPSFEKWIDLAADGYASQGIEIDAVSVREKLVTIFVGRYEALMSDLKHDVFASATDSASPEQILNPKLIRTRAQAMAVLDKDHSLIQTMVRPINILSAAMKKGNLELPDALNVESLHSDSGALLAEKVASSKVEVERALDREESEILVDELKKLSGSIYEFFEGTMIMDEDATVRMHRLKLVSETTDVILSVGDFTKIVIEG